jgi:threonine aldolase
MHIELRSDTFTKPGPAMLQAMMAAETGDDVFGEDPTINRLEAYAASLFGMEAGLYCPSGTMTNQIAIRCHTRPGDEVICESLAHVYIYEGGGMASNSQVQARPLLAERGLLDARQVEAAINPDDIHKAPTRLVCLENTSNRGGGSCYTQDAMDAIANVCRSNHLALHLDGARIFNAIVAKGEDPRYYGKTFDSVSVCLSKGLGAPVGSVLLGKRDWIQQARRVRKVFGGGMRQAGYLAAAGLYALEHQVLRLREDHLHASMLADTLRELPWVANVHAHETNIVLFDLAAGLHSSQVVAQLAAEGLRAGATGPTQIRFVTHLDVSPDQIKTACKLLREVSIKASNHL